jgi:hypothetical protein
VFELDNLRFGVQLFSFENVYGLDDASCVVTEDGGERTIRCSSLTWAGGQERVPGRASVRAVKGERKTTFHVEAQLDRTIRSTKLFLRGLPDGDIVNLRETDRLAIPPQGLNLRYPDGWRGLYTPLVVLRTKDGDSLYFRSLAPGVRETRFAFNHREDGLEVELIYEELATDMASRVTVPAWEVGRAESLEEVMAEQTAWLEHTYGLTPWETRPDVPAWARDVALVAGEGWYDGLGVATPLVQSGHTDGVLHWHDAPYPALFDTYGRSFGHLCLGDPGRGSTGVHELGHNAFTRTPLRKGVLPTVTFVDDTLQKAPEKVEAILEDASAYAATFLTGAAVHD